MVFVSMLLLSATHTHGSEPVANVACQECQHHVNHSHIGMVDSCIDNCVLCQFLSLPFLLTSTITIGLLPLVHLSRESRVKAAVFAGHVYEWSGRAPPME